MDIESHVCGAFSGAQEADESVHLLTQKLKVKVGEKLNKSFDTFTAVKYKSQPVCGVNYYLKIHVGSEEYIHVKAFEALPCYRGEVELKGIQEGKTLADELDLFD